MTRAVLKFGGTSVASPTALESVARIVASHKGDRVVVVSATAGTTDALHLAAREAEQGRAAEAERVMQDISKAHANLAADLLGVNGGETMEMITELTQRTVGLLHSVAVLRECTARTLDAIVTYGEHVSAPLIAALLKARGVKAEYVSAEGLIITDDAFGHANPLMDETKRRVQATLLPRLKDGVVPVVTGYAASTAEGVTTTLGRGGSDYSAAVLAAALNADELQIFTDVSGVMSADPRIVNGAKPLAKMSYAEAAELAYFGAKVIHPRTVLPAIEARIPVRILNTFAPADAGTTITADPVFDGSVVKATTSLGGLGLITVQGAGMSGVPGFAARVFDTTAAEKVSVLMISQSSSENSICLVVPAGSTERLKPALERMFSAELRRHDVERVDVDTPVAIVAAVGEGMRGTPGVAARVFGALGRAKVNVMAIAQGSSELNISLVVAENDREKAVRAIHEEFHAA
ncbi:MAG: aspartate kinase [Chloroflexi bacterium]|nr:MAG: aspartate kinase [Chloroflexota bacterium]TMB95697.1 MAG: aspartate kinase [Chloroflexota bacterium]TMC33526.1 MAG: aspartate kinase [Chloroflexota bacterium]